MSENNSGINIQFEPTDIHPESGGYSFAVWAGVRKVASADNRSIFYRACAKFVSAIRKQN